MLRFERIGFQDDVDARYGAVVVTSANALRAVEADLAGSRLLKLPLFAVGEHTAAAARHAGFDNVIAADGDATALGGLMLASVKAKTLKKASPIMYVAGADLARDLVSELGDHGFTVITHTTYRMVPVNSLPREVCDAFAANRIAAVLHYSRRSARAFLNAVRVAGIEISALAIPHGCISDSVATILRDAGATQVAVARSPDENALFGALDRALRPISR